MLIISQLRLLFSLLFTLECRTLLLYLLCNNNYKMTTKKTTRLYSRNREVLEKTIRCLKSKPIVAFTSQNQLFRFIEDIKYPENKRYQRDGMPYYFGEKNYGPVIEKLKEMGILHPVQSKIGKRIIKFHICRFLLNPSLASE